MMQNKRNSKERKFEVEVGTPDVDLRKRLIDLTAAELVEIVDARLAMFLDGGAKSENDDGLLDRGGAAKFLKISLSKLDVLCREGENPLPFVRVGDSRRFDRDELRSYALRQRGDK